MKEKFENNTTDIIEYLPPVRIIDKNSVEGAENLFIDRQKSVTFTLDNMATLRGVGSYIILDFGKEICGGVRIISRIADPMPCKLRLVFGESVSEALSTVGEKGATNDHSPRDFEVVIPLMCDLTFGQTGFRFVKIELIEGNFCMLQSVSAALRLTEFENKGFIKTGDDRLDEILDVAEYTLHLNFQNGYIWDGIKRDRLVWSGDLNPEILSALYMYGSVPNITNSLDFLRADTPEGAWINAMPPYSAWWLINLCDYVRITGDSEYYNRHKDYALEILEHIDSCVKENGDVVYENEGLKPFLDWPTYETPDAEVGTAAVYILASKAFLLHEDNSHARNIIKKLSPYLTRPVQKKQTKAFQILSGADKGGGKAFLENGLSRGMSTFMSYYILKAAANCGSDKTVDMIKEYYGGMLDRGATTYWEDFDISWLEGSGRIDEIPKAGERDLHADFGAFCYKNLRHSLCHGWSTGIIAFVIEYLFGVRVEEGYKKVYLNPHPINDDMTAMIPTPYGYMTIVLKNGEITIDAPEEIEIIK